MIQNTKVSRTLKTMHVTMGKLNDIPGLSMWMSPGKRPIGSHLRWDPAHRSPPNAANASPAATSHFPACSIDGFNSILDLSG